MAIHAIEQVEQALEIVMGISCWTRTKAFEQPFPLGWCDHASSCHDVSPYNISNIEQPRNSTSICASVPALQSLCRLKSPPLHFRSTLLHPSSAAKTTFNDIDRRNSRALPPAIS